MYKLIGHTLAKGEWFEPESQPMVLQERESTTTITLGPGSPEIEFDDWILDDEWPEGPYVWRVKDIDWDAGTDTGTVEMEHVIKALDDDTLDETTVETIAGSGATTCTAQAAAAYILSQHSAWTLGDFEYDVSNPYEFDGETLLDALKTVTDTLSGAVWEYDLSVFPFVLHVRHRDSTVQCEMRAGRNLSTLRRKLSRSGMYTRIYATGKNNLHVTLSKNESLYGRVDHRETDQSKSTEENLRAWAQGRLDNHCEPRVSITVSGIEMSQETGEPLDNLRLNKICRVPLPEYARTITERIVKKQWRDRKKNPENVTLTLANNSVDISTIVKEQTRSGSGGRAGAGQAKQNWLFEANGEHLLYEVFDECGHVHGLLRMTEESLRIAFENLNDSTRSEFRLTAESLRIQFENEISSTRSEFEMTSQSLRIEFENEASSLRSSIQAEAGRIGLIVEGYGASAEVKRASIILAINNGTSSAHIDADEVYIGNQKSTTVINGKLSAEDITAQYINAVYADADLVAGNDIYCSDLTAMGTIEAYQMGASIVDCGVITFDSGAHSFSNCIVSATVDSTTGVVTLTYADGTPVTFSRAAPTERVVGTWSGSTFTVASSANGQSLPISATVYQAVEGTANPGTTIYAKTYKNAPTQGNEILTTAMTLTENVANKEVTLTANSLTKGKISTQATWNAGANSVTISSISAPAGTSSSAMVTATASNGATKTATVSASGGGFADGGVYAYAKLGSTTVARQWISLPSSATWSHYWNGTQGVAVTCTIGGKAYNAYFEVGV